MTPSKTNQTAFATPAMEATQAWRNHAARFTVHWGRAGAVVAANGEIDAANADSFADDAKRCADCCEWLILDLSELTFIGTAGVSALQAISAQCSGAQTRLMVIPSPALTTVLRICDAHSHLPLVGSLTEALSDVHRSGRPLRLVP